MTLPKPLPPERSGRDLDAQLAEEFGAGACYTHVLDGSSRSAHYPTIAAAEASTHIHARHFHVGAIVVCGCVPQFSTDDHAAVDLLLAVAKRDDLAWSIGSTGVKGKDIAAHCYPRKSGDRHHGNAETVALAISRALLAYATAHPSAPHEETPTG